jgi:PEP-CTERM motif
MKLSIVSLAILCLALMVTPASAQVLYDDGPINGTTNGWTINFGYVTSDTFTLLNNSTVGGFDFGVWEFPGDILTSVGWSITSQPNYGTVYGSGTASGSSLTDQFISMNQYGYHMDEITVTGLNVNLKSGTTYWLNLQNAVVPSGDPVFWDENSGAGCTGDDGKGGGCPSQATCSDCIRPGNIPPESFDITGTTAVPEPGSVLLLGSGVLVCAGRLRRWRF